MGVTNLWTILAPVKKHKKLHELKGQTIAVDLSIWVCENQSVKQMHGVIVKPHLRNLFFRVSYLTQLGAKLVFVIEGEAPELKWEEMWKRQQARGLLKSGASFKHCKRKRSQFTACLRECCELLDILGIPHVTAKGEAEAMCAALNAAGLVDACITDDGDAFLYGAQTVYRNFTMNSKDPHVESFNMGDIEGDLGISRRHLVALSLLLGCDYLPGGVAGVGVANAVKLLKSLEDVDVISRLTEWRRMTSSQCVNKVEMSIREKAIRQPDFPQQQVIDEFLIMKEKLPSRGFLWKKAKISSAQTFAASKLDWPIEYTLEKVLPLVTVWSMWDSKKNGHSKFHIKPHRIVKSRVRHGVPCYEVEWIKDDYDTTSTCDYYTTVEEQSLFTDCFPHLVDDFDAQQAQKKSKKRVSKKKVKKDRDAEEVENITSQIDSFNLNSTSNIENPNKEPMMMPKERSELIITHIDGLARSDHNSVDLQSSALETFEDLNSCDDTPNILDDEEVFVPLSVRLKNRQARSISRSSSDICDSQSKILSVLPHHPRLICNQDFAKINEKFEPSTKKIFKSKDSYQITSVVPMTPESMTSNKLPSSNFLDKEAASVRVSSVPVLNYSQSQPNKLSPSKTRLSAKGSFSVDEQKRTSGIQHIEDSKSNSRNCSEVPSSCPFKDSLQDNNLSTPKREVFDFSNDFTRSFRCLSLVDNAGDHSFDEVMNLDSSNFITDEHNSVSSNEKHEEHSDSNYFTGKSVPQSSLTTCIYSDSSKEHCFASVMRSPRNTNDNRKELDASFSNSLISDNSNSKQMLSTKLIYSATKPARKEVHTPQYSTLWSFQKTPTSSSLNQTCDMTFGNFNLQASLLNSLLQTSNLESPRIPLMIETVNDNHRTELTLSENQTSAVESGIHSDSPSIENSLKYDLKYLRSETFEYLEELDSPSRRNTMLEISMPIPFSPMTPEIKNNFNEKVKISQNYQQLDDDVFRSPVRSIHSLAFTGSSPALLLSDIKQFQKNLDYGDNSCHKPSSLENRAENNSEYINSSYKNDTSSLELSVPNVLTTLTPEIPDCENVKHDQKNNTVFQSPKTHIHPFATKQLADISNLTNECSPRQPLSLKDRLKLRLKSHSTQSALRDLSS